jgi:hypothetical protein
VQNIDNANSEIRWRAASDLALLVVDEKTHIADPQLALDLTQRLQQALDASRQAERPLSSA